MTDNILDRIKTGDQLDRMVFPPMAWAVPGLIPEGFGLLTGAPKAGKSWAVLDIALAVACGGQALGKITVGDPRPVFYLALEDGDRRLQDRARQLLGPGVRIPRNLNYITDATPVEVLDLIGAWLAEHDQRSPLVVLDTLGKVMPPAAPGEGAYQRDYRVGSVLKRHVDRRPGSSLVVVHHTRKAGSDDWMDSTSGTNGLNGAADFTVNLSRSRNDTAGTIRVTGRDVLEGEYAVTTSSGRWTIDGTALADAAKKAVELKVVSGLGDRSAEIIEYVTKQDEPITPKRVEEALDLPDARRYLARLVDAGRLTRSGRGLYTCVPTVPVSHLNGTSSHGWDNGTHGTPHLTALSDVEDECRLHGTEYKSECYTCEAIGGTVS